MANSLAQRLTGFGHNIANALFGVQPTQVQAPPKYPSEITDYLDDLENQSYMQPLLNQPKETGLTLDQYKEGVTQGLNFGVPEIAQWQKDHGINIPKTGEEIASAKAGIFNTYPMQGSVVAMPRQGGILDDISSGYRENYDNGFNVNNLVPQKKNFATRLGEGLGSIGRFIDSPLGRGLIAAGLNKAMGYDNSLQEGLQAYVGRQNYKTADTLYRNQLKNNYGFTDEELDNIRGNIDSTMFNNLTKSQTSAMNLALKQQTTQSMNRLRELQIEKQKILNSTLPEEQKAKLIKLNAEAAHAEEMQMAKINYYTNAAANPLGWANYNLKAADDKRKEELNDLKKQVIKELIGDNKPSASTNNPPPKNNHKSNAF